MQKSKIEEIARRAQVDTMLRAIDSLRRMRRDDAELLKQLDWITITGLDAYVVTRAGLQ